MSTTFFVVFFFVIRSTCPASSPSFSTLCFFRGFMAVKVQEKFVTLRRSTKFPQRVRIRIFSITSTSTSSFIFLFSSSSSVLSLLLFQRCLTIRSGLLILIVHM